MKVANCTAYTGRDLRKETIMAETALKNSNAPDIVQSIVKRIETIEEEVATRKATFMAYCKVAAGDRKDLLTEAKNRGVNTRALKAELKARKLELKADSIRNDLEPDDRADADTIAAALGDFGSTGLGAHAINQARDAEALADIA
jgi:uncharacterized protein (UPF0335 family)